MATIYDVRDALLNIGDISVYHFQAPEQRPNKFIIWAETSINLELDADDEPRIARPRGQIYFYSDEEYDKKFNDIVSNLIDSGVTFTITNIGWDYALKLFIYQIDWEGECGTGEIY